MAGLKSFHRPLNRLDLQENGRVEFTTLDSLHVEPLTQCWHIAISSIAMPVLVFPFLCFRAPDFFLCGAEKDSFYIDRAAAFKVTCGRSPLHRLHRQFD